MKVYELIGLLQKLPRNYDVNIAMVRGNEAPDAMFFQLGRLLECHRHVHIECRLDLPDMSHGGNE